MSKSIPYQKATSGDNARNEIIKLLQGFGCERVGFMDNFADNELILGFVYRGRNIEMKVSAQGWANLFLRKNPHTYRHTRSKQEYEKVAHTQGMIAMSSVLRDWVKGQLTAVEAGMAKFDHVFMPFMLTQDGKTIGQHMDKVIDNQTNGLLRLPFQGENE